MSQRGRKFFVTERLGSGAYGSVYLAEQDSGAGFRRRVALKLLHQHHSEEKEAGKRMRDEARILGRLSHRNIVTVLDLVRLQDRWAVVMDYVQGIDLERLTRAMVDLNEPFPPGAALEIGAAIGDALHAAWIADDGQGRVLGVVHRDIKPSNVLLTSDGEVKVLDFGVARVNLESREGKTGFRVGTERYMAPERIVGEEDTPQGDVYAAAATVAELLLLRPIGRTPVLPDRHEVFVNDTLTAVRGALGGMPEDVQDEVIGLLGRALHAEVAHRPVARDFSDDCSRLCRMVGGESLRQFTRRVVPQAELTLATEREPVEGVVFQEESTGAPSSTLGASVGLALPSPSSSATYADRGDNTLTPPDNRRLGVGALVGAGAAVIVLLAACVVVGAWFLNGTPTEPTPPTAAALTTEPAAAPAPAEAAPADPPPAPPPEVAPEPPPEPTRPDPLPPIAPPRPSAAKAPPVAPEPAPPVAAGPTVSRAMVVVRDASSMQVTCGDRTAAGSTSARITDFPAGTCRVTAVMLDRTLTGTANIDKPREVYCTATDGALSCP
jgi:serine/threonine-protein kinase